MGAAVLLAMFAAVSGATPAAAQDGMSLLGNGSEAKAHAGAGLLASRNAPANHYNPANLTYAPEGFEAYAALDLLSLSYGYAYPGYDAVFVEARTPVPFFGGAWSPFKGLAVGFSLLPIPAGSGGRVIEDLPTRKFAGDQESKPVLLDVETKGEGVSVHGTLGVGARIISGLDLGLSVIFSQGGGSMEARSNTDDAILVQDTNRSTSYAFVAGVRASALAGRLLSAFAVHPPSTSSTRGTSRYPSVDPDAEVDKKGEGHGPWSFGAGLAGKIHPDWQPFVEYRYTAWRRLRSEKGQALLDKAERDLFDTHDLALGLDFRLAGQALTAAYGRYQSGLGDGIMDFESADGKELLGMEFQNIDSMPRSVYAGGWRLKLPAGHFQTGLSYARGSREVWQKARGYGSYDLVIIQILAGGTWAF